MDKAEEYAARQRLQLVRAFEANSFTSDQLETFLADAFRAGYQAGLVDAHRKEFKTEPQAEYLRGLDQ